MVANVNIETCFDMPQPRLRERHVSWIVATVAKAFSVFVVHARIVTKWLKGGSAQ